jgi:hypothetical protein
VIKEDEKELLRIPYHGKDILELMEKHWTSFSNKISKKRIFSVGGFRGYHGAFEQENTDFEKNALFQINDEFIGLMELEIICRK